jgi:hypothetical protein
MSSTTSPKASGYPILMPKKPVDRERDQRVRNVLVRVPIVRKRIMHTKTWEVGVATQTIDVMSRLSSSSWVSADRRIENHDAFCRILQNEARVPPERNIGDPDLVLLEDGGQISFPHPHEAKVIDQLEIRILLPDTSILFCD